MSNEPLAKKKQAAGGTTRQAHALNALPWLWLGLSAVWAVVIFATDQVAWPLALWIATTTSPSEESTTICHWSLESFGSDSVCGKASDAEDQVRVIAPRA